MHITLSSGVFPNKTERVAGTTAPVFELSYNQQNSLYAEVNKTPVEFRPGHTSLGFLGQVTSHATYNSGEAIHLYSIWVSPPAFDRFCEAVCGKSSTGFHSFQKGNYYCCDFKYDAREEGLVKKLGACLAKPADNMNLLLLESHILELLSINIEKLLGEGCSENRLAGLSKADIKCLAYAREVLLARLASPPTLLELSRMIRMNDCKLKRSFKTYYGKTVYEFVREQRMEQAFYLLQNEEYNVSQSAFAVGYTNISHFSEAFRKKFGILPSALMRAGRFTALGPSPNSPLG
ncbi:MAG: helix-turn-helix domain-containing protein [Oscillospiraceae bacterium]